MKLKNSYILIAISIFLLISIGSVCASENVTSDSDAQLADDGTDVVLSDDTDDNLADDTTQERINTTVETNKSSYEFKEDDSNKNFAVTVKNNKTGAPIDNIDKNNLSVYNGTKPILFEYENSIIRITEQLPCGKYNFTISFLGNDAYINSSTVVSVKIYGNNTIETETSVVCDGENIEIPVTVKDPIDVIELVKDNFNLTLVYTNETGNVSNLTITEFDITNDKIKFTIDNISKLNNASLIINYANATEPKTVDIKVITAVKAKLDEYEFKSEQNKSISIEIKDGKGNQLTVYKTDLKVLDNEKEITDFTLNNTNLTLKLDVGVHNITITYIGDETYNASTSTSIRINVTGNNTLEVPDSVVANNASSVEISINLTDGVYDNTYLLNASNTNVTYNNTVINDIDWDKVKATNKLIINLTNGIVPTTVIITYTENGKSIVKTVLVKFPTTVQIPESINIAEGENATFIVTIYGADGNPITLTKSDLNITGANNKFNETTGNLTLTGLKKGIYNITVTYKGNEVNNTSKANILINVRGAIEINTNGTAVNVNSTKKGEIQIINITNGVDTFDFTKENLNITVTYKDGNETKNIIPEWKIVNGTIVFTLENGNFTTANLTINYTGSANAIKVIKLNRVYNIQIDAINNVVEYQSGKLIYKLTDIDTNRPLANKTINLEYKIITGSVTISGISGSGITIVSTIINSTDENGVITFDNNKMNAQGWGFMDVGNHTVTLKSSTFNKTNGTSQNMIINKANINIVIDNYKEYYGSSKKVKITVTNANNGDPVQGIILHLYMPQTSGKDYYFQTNVNGTSEINVMGLVGGDYEMTVSNNDTKNMNNASTKTTVTVMKIPVKIAASGLTVYYNTGATATIKVTKDGKAVSGMYLLVRLYSTSTKYNDYLFQTNDKGQVSFSASLTVGKHKMIINSADNRYEASQVTKTITVKKASAKITAKKVTDYYKGVKYFTVKLTNTKNNKPIYDAKLNIKVFVSKNRYYNYNGHTGANGEIRLSLETLKPGTYKVVVSGADSKDFTAKEVTSKIVIKKAPAKLTPKKLTAKKGAKKYFKVTVKNKKTKKVIKGVKVKIKVYTGKKAKTFTAKTNAKGIAKILTNKLKVGKHKVVVASANKYVTAKKAKSTIKITK